MFDDSFDKYVDSAMNIQDESEIAESSEVFEDENDEIKFDPRELQHESAVKVRHVLDFCFYISHILDYFFLVGS